MASVRAAAIAVSKSCPKSIGTSSLRSSRARHRARRSEGSEERSFATTCHGAGRRMSRTGARRQITGAELRTNRGPGDRGALPVQPRPGRGGAVRFRGCRARRGGVRAGRSRGAGGPAGAARRCQVITAASGTRRDHDWAARRRDAPPHGRRGAGAPTAGDPIGPGATGTRTIAGPGGVTPRILHHLAWQADLTDRRQTVLLPRPAGCRERVEGHEHPGRSSLTTTRFTRSRVLHLGSETTTSSER